MVRGRRVAEAGTSGGAARRHLDDYLGRARPCAGAPPVSRPPPQLGTRRRAHATFLRPMFSVTHIRRCGARISEVAPPLPTVRRPRTLFCRARFTIARARVGKLEERVVQVPPQSSFDRTKARP